MDSFIRFGLEHMSNFAYFIAVSGVSQANNSEALSLRLPNCHLICVSSFAANAVVSVWPMWVCHSMLCRQTTTMVCHCLTSRLLFALILQQQQWQTWIHSPRWMQWPFSLPSATEAVWHQQHWRMASVVISPNEFHFYQIMRLARAPQRNINCGTSAAWWPSIC